MDNQRMSQRDMLAAIKEAVDRKHAGEDPYADPTLRKRLPKQEFVAPDITPSKPDPERDANQAIEDAANGRSPALQKMIEARKSNPINPETGMPFYSAPEAQEAPESEDPADAERRMIRMQMLQEAAKTGRMPSYLKK